MGQQAVCEVRVRRGTALEEGEARALLESTELILRGGFKRRFAIAALSEVQAVGDELRFTHVAEAGREQVMLLLGEKQAAKWALKISTPPPSLAHKLGLGASAKAFVIGRVNDIDDAPLADALKGHGTRSAAQAAVVVAVMRSEAELQAAMAAHAAMPCPMLWAVYPKGKASTLTDATVRATLRAAGYMDNKTTAVSDVLIATRYKRGA